MIIALIKYNSGIFQEYEYTQDWIYETENRYKYDDDDAYQHWYEYHLTDE